MEQLPTIPGGWMETTIRLAGRPFRLTLPADPEAFLDDPEIQAANRRDDYMPYWPYLWPMAVPMAEAVLRAEWPPDQQALEIGAGIGLVGLAAVARGLHVTFSDYQQEAITLALHNARQNDFSQIEGLWLDWHAPPQRQFSVILGCDVAYERDNQEPILDLIEQMLSPGGVCWIGDPGRWYSAEFLQAARSRAFSVEQRPVPIASLEEANPATATAPDAVAYDPRILNPQIIVLRRATE